MIKEYLEIGQIVSTHGVKGELRVQPWCDSPEFMKKFKTLYFDSEGKCPAKVISCRPHGNIVLLKIDSTDTVEQAQAMRNKILYMRRSDANIPDGEYFIQELIGCKVFDADTGAEYGALTDVSETGANDVWHITSNGTEYLIPAIPDVVINVDVAGDRVEIRPLKGIFDGDIYAD